MSLTMKQIHRHKVQTCSSRGWEAESGGGLD